jgi:hypothetical protein
MAKVEPSNGKHGLGGSKDADLEGIDPNTYEVHTEETKLVNARRDFPKYDWFISYTIKDKAGNDVRTVPEYTIKFDKPISGNLYYYLNGAVYRVQYEDAEDKGSKKRAKAKLTVGDPPVGAGGG